MSAVDTLSVTVVLIGECHEIAAAMRPLAISSVATSLLLSHQDLGGRREWSRRRPP